MTTPDRLQRGRLRVATKPVAHPTDRAPSTRPRHHLGRSRAPRRSAHPVHPAHAPPSSGLTQSPIDWPTAPRPQPTHRPPITRAPRAAPGHFHAASVSNPAAASSETRQSGLLRSTNRQRPRPRMKRRGEGGRDRWNDVLERRVRVRIMTNQRIKSGPVFRRENPRHRLRVGRVAAKPVNRFGAERDERAIAQQFRRARDAVRTGQQNLRHADVQ